MRIPCCRFRPACFLRGYRLSGMSTSPPNQKALFSVDQVTVLVVKLDDPGRPWTVVNVLQQLLQRVFFALRLALDLRAAWLVSSNLNIMFPFTREDWCSSAY